MGIVSEVISVIEDFGPVSAKEICKILDLEPEREKEVYEAIKKAARVLKRKGKRLMMEPPRCRNCGFELDGIKASKCPKCKSERIEEARFFIV